MKKLLHYLIAAVAFCLVTTIFLASCTYNYYEYEKPKKGSGEPQKTTPKPQQTEIVKKLPAPVYYRPVYDPIHIGEAQSFVYGAYNAKVYYYQRIVRSIELTARGPHLSPYKIMAFNYDGMTSPNTAYWDQVFQQIAPNFLWTDMVLSQNERVRKEHVGTPSRKETQFCIDFATEAVNAYYDARKASQKK